jgi:hypothetical protein
VLFDLRVLGFQFSQEQEILMLVCTDCYPEYSHYCLLNLCCENSGFINCAVGPPVYVFLGGIVAKLRQQERESREIVLSRACDDVILASVGLRIVKGTLTLFYGNICYSFSGISLHSRRAGPRTLRLKNRGNPSLPGTVVRLINSPIQKMFKPTITPPITRGMCRR